MSFVTTLIKSREQLARWFHGEGVELGVAAGNYSSTILRESRCTRLWSIDRWSDHHNTKEYRQSALRLTNEGQGRCIPLRISFTEAAPLFADRSLQFIYVDGYAHTGQESGETLETWWPKLKPGGVMAGHDYHPEWPLTIAAVDAFAARHGLQLSFTQEQRPNGFPSWFTTKPHTP